MKYKILEFSDISPEEVNEFIKCYPKSTYFHTYNYFLGLKQTKGYKPVSIIVKDDNNSIQACLVGELSNEFRYLPFITKRLIIFSPPLYSNIDFLKLILEELIKKKYGLFIQIRSFYFFSDEEKQIYKLKNFTFSNHLNAFLRITEDNQDGIMKRFEKDKRKGIRQAIEKYGVEISEYSDLEYSINEFYFIQEKLFKSKRHSLKSKSYFKNLIINSKGNIRIAFAIYEDRPIASQLYVIETNKITALYTATLPDHKEKHAGDLLIWYLIKESFNHNKQFFDFGGGGDPEKEYSPRNYKKRFGTTFQNVGRFTYSKSKFYKLLIFIYYKVVKK